MFAAEYESLRHVWFPLVRVEDLRRHGVLPAGILDTELVVFYAGGATTVADRYCPHRGMALNLGSIVDGCLQCPYHGWLFEPVSGRCTRVPSLPEEIVPARTALRTYPVREAYGHVWSCLADPLLPLPDLPDTADPGWEFGYGEPTELHCGLRQITENFRDMSHFAFVHTASMGPRVRRVVDPYTVQRDGWSLQWTLGTDLGGTALDSNPGLSGGQTLTYRLAMPMFASVRTSFPDGGHRLVAQFVTPLSLDPPRVRHFWLVGFDDVVRERHGVRMPQMWEYERQIFAEDFPIVENQRPAEAPLEVHGQAHTRADHFSLSYRRLYQEMVQAFGDGAPAAAVR